MFTAIESYICCKCAEHLSCASQQATARCVFHNAHGADKNSTIGNISMLLLHCRLYKCISHTISYTSIRYHSIGTTNVYRIKSRFYQIASNLTILYWCVNFEIDCVCCY